MELLAWELRRPYAVTWEQQSFGPPHYSFDDIDIMPFTTLLSAQYLCLLPLCYLRR